ncbi:hypothetical protein [Commensalibacter nepenthis]|uniref:Secreted protein n=1 Tax=Commensalibacter nepenthis TaxID=3043872 RepID=A0ABT6QC80_9PROT|nr:hypothetical protein [Commensalibacter sp. TBRC 10068]MDI2113955.1 hypothetical protein [Commensalibacter sp. TBRC 10068]
MPIKKILVILPILSLPLTAIAQNTPEKLPGNITNTITDKFAPVVCREGLKRAIEEVQKCYKNTPAKYLQIEQCMVADIAITVLANIDNETRKKYDLPIKYTTPYIDLNQYDERIDKYRKTIPEYQNYDQQDFLKYIGKSSDSLLKKIILMKKDKTINCVE